MKTIIRTLRTGGKTQEFVPDWLADMIVAAAHEEENTASLRVVDGIAVITPVRQDWRELALGMADMTMRRAGSIH